MDSILGMEIFQVKVQFYTQDTGANLTTGTNLSKEILEEAYIMASVDHPNLLQLLAVCMTNQIMMVTQLMPLGCLLDYVRNNKDKVSLAATLEIKFIAFSESSNEFGSILKLNIHFF